MIYDEMTRFFWLWFITWMVSHRGMSSNVAGSGILVLAIFSVFLLPNLADLRWTSPVVSDILWISFAIEPKAFSSNLDSHSTHWLSKLKVIMNTHWKPGALWCNCCPCNPTMNFCHTCWHATGQINDGSGWICLSWCCRQIILNINCSLLVVFNMRPRWPKGTVSELYRGPPSN